MAFSLQQRPGLIDRLEREHFDLLVVGGGVTGAGIARDAALRGLSVALVERGDFAEGTSSRSSKLIHGGLRYLEQGEVGLVHEAVRERQRLLRLAPHLARPQSFVVPVFKHSKHSVLLLDLGLTIYDMLAAFSGVLRHRAFRRAALLELEPHLREDGLRGGVRYYDARTDDGRLTLANVRGAHRAGAVCLSRVSFESPLLSAGRVQGAVVHDLHTNRRFELRTRVVVLAAGPWSDDAMERWLGRPAARQLIRPSKGVHVVLPRARLPLSTAVVMTAADGRVVFALPWSHATIIGTTDTPFTGDLRQPRVTLSDARYLLDTANAHLVCERGPLKVEDIISAWAGIRPLAVGTRDDADGTYKTSREHMVQTDPRGMVLIAGGKLTTYRAMAEEAVDEACKLLPEARLEGVLPSPTARLPLPGAEHLPRTATPMESMARQLARRRDCTATQASRLTTTWGSDAEQVLQYCVDTADGFEPVVPGLPHLLGEVRWVIEREMAMNLVDVCVRRLPLYFYAGERLLEVAPALAARICAWSGQPEERAAEMLAALHAHVELHRIVADESDH